MRIDVLPTFDDIGQALGDAIVRAFARETVRIVGDRSPLAVTKSVTLADVVVLDLTPSPDGIHRYTTMSYPWRNDHVLAVSRSYLPANVAPRRRGGAAVYPGSKTTEQIVEWVKAQVDGDGAIQRRSRLHRLATAVIGGAHQAGAQRTPWEAVDCFVSYRRMHQAAAAELTRRLQEGWYHGGRAQKVVMFETGELASPEAILPPMFRWNLLAIISDVVANCSEFWAIGAGQGYLDSWWTQGELLCRQYFGNRALLRLVDPCLSTVDELPLNDEVLSEHQRNRFARHFANSHPDLMAPESTEAMRLLRPTRLPMANDDVFSEANWTVPLLECPECSFEGGRVLRLDAAAFLDNTAPRLYPVNPDRLAQCAASGAALECPNGCEVSFTVRELPPQYLWYALPVGPHRSFLEPVPVYAATAVR